MIQKQMQADMIAALKNRDAVRRGALSFLISEIKTASIGRGDKTRGVPMVAGIHVKEAPVEEFYLPDNEVIPLLQKQVKKREETLKAIEDGSRPDLYASTQNEISIIKEYLPEAPSDEAIHDVVREVVESLSAASMKDMGKVMAAASKQLPNAEKSVISAIAKELLAK